MKKMHGISTKAFAALLAVTLLVGSAIGGTLAWLTSTSNELVNTFTIGNVKIELTETKGEGSSTEKNFKVTPGVNIEKDPKVTVDESSEDCWLFVKITEDGTAWNNGLSYKPASGWTKLEGVGEIVYYRDITGAANKGQALSVLENDQVIVGEELTTLDENTKLTFTAYAIQKEGFTKETINDAWEAVSNPQN